VRARITCFALLSVATLPACAARLSTPVRVREAEPWLVKRTTVSERPQRGGEPQCVREVTLEIAHLPGAAYALDVQPGLFASSEFSVTLHESGTLRQVTLNSDPQVDEALEAVGGLGESLAAAAARVAPLLAPPASVEVLPGAPCTPGAAVKLAPLACFAEPRPQGLDPARCPPAGAF
jgi:hypothetical protein